MCSGEGGRRAGRVRRRGSPLLHLGFVEPSRATPSQITRFEGACSSFWGKTEWKSQPALPASAQAS